VIGESKFTYDLWSDAVNLASRLESVAEPGQILVSEEIIDRAGNDFSFEPLGSVELKGAGMTPVFGLRQTGSSESN
jgi:class 3 adenylate cyclase